MAEPAQEFLAGASASPPASAGARLRAAREAAGVHIGGLAVALKVPVAKLEALEADRLDLLPDAVFARALASSICRALKIDAAEVLQLLPEGAVPSLEFAARPAAATVPSRLAGPHRMRLSRVSRPVAVGAALLVLAALALLIYPAAFIDVEGEMQEASAPLAATAVPAPAPAVQPEGAQSFPGLAATVPAVQAEPMAAAPAGVASAPAAAPADDTLRITARAASWVQVTDAGGATPLRRTLAEGESVAVSGTLPLSVVVGRVDAVEVTVRGAPFDLAPVARNNTARFQVK